jgi:hypothetical protein
MCGTYGAVMKGGAIAMLAISHWGCTTTIEVVAPCAANSDEQAAVERAVGHLQAFSGRRRLAVARACAEITFDLTGEALPVDRPLSQASAKAICAVAKPAIESRLDDDTELAGELEDYGGCFPFLAAVQDCLDDCGASDVCDDACGASGIFQGGCRLPRLRVESNDPTLGATMKDNFGPILALDLFVARDAGDGMDRLEAALATIRADLGDSRSCGSERSALDELNADAKAAHAELIDLLSWMRISRLSIIE